MMGLSIGRQVEENIPPGDAFASSAMAAMAFLGLAHTFKRGEMIRVGLLLERLHGRTKQAFEILSLGIATAFVAYFTWYAGAMTYDSWRFNDMAQGVLAVPLWIPQLGYAIGLIVLFIAFLDEFVRVLAGHPPAYEKAPPASAEEAIERAVQTGI